jgi:hypothetical protein
MRVEVITSPTGQRRAYIREGYRDESGRAQKRTVEKLGLVDTLEAADPDWRAKAQARALELTTAKQSTTQALTVDWGAPADPNGARNIGWQVIDAVWDHLELGPWLKRRARNTGWGGDVANTLRVLVACQVLWPGSKRAAVQNTHRLWGAAQLDLKATYRALDKIAESSARIQARARRALTGRDETLQVVFYDVTNYFFTIDQPDLVDAGDRDPARGTAGRGRGACKEHRPESIIQMGLFMDTTGLPISYRLFHGPTPDCVTLRAALSEFKDQFGAPRVSVVADAAMNNAQNLVQLVDANDDWVFAASIRKTTKTIRAWVLDDQGWTYEVNSDGLVTARTKSKVITRTVSFRTPEGQRVSREVTEKVVARWSADYTNRQRVKRAELAAKAAVLANDPTKWKANTKRGAAKYVLVEQADPATGEVGNATPVLSLDTIKLDDDAQLDGYWLLHSSRTEASASRLLADYTQLWQIEDAFRVTKTELNARPVFLRTPAHIEAHFLVCFLALLVTRLLQRLLNLPAGQVRALLKDLSVSHGHGDVYLVNRTPGWDHIDQVLKINTDRKWIRITDLRAWRRLIRAAVTAKTKHSDHPYPLPT